jgi:hypothetical protein
LPQPVVRSRASTPHCGERAKRFIIFVI